jgi:hypothetical protein
MFFVLMIFCPILFNLTNTQDQHGHESFCHILLLVVCMLWQLQEWCLVDLYKNISFRLHRSKTKQVLHWKFMFLINCNLKISFLKLNHIFICINIACVVVYKKKLDLKACRRAHVLFMLIVYSVVTHIDYIGGMVVV